MVFKSDLLLFKLLVRIPKFQVPKDRKQTTLGFFFKQKLWDDEIFVIFVGCIDTGSLAPLSDTVRDARCVCRFTLKYIYNMARLTLVILWGMVTVIIIVHSNYWIENFVIFNKIICWEPKLIRLQ